MPLMTGNGSNSSYDFSTLVELLRTRAAETPKQRAYTFLANGEEETGSLTYAELDCQARAVGACLQAVNAPGQRALLLYPPGLDFISAFFGCLYAGVIAVPCNPPKLNRKVSRLQAIIEDCQASHVLTTSSFLPKINQGLADESRGAALLVTDELAESLASAWNEPRISPDALAFIQYTSGSTSRPKGVMISHGNVLYNLSYLDYSWLSNGHSVGLSWLPHFHDMGLIAGIIKPLFKNFHGYLMSPATFLQRPTKWLQAISRYHVTLSGGPNFAYDLAVEKSTEEQRDALDLSCWDVAYSGAEPVRKRTVERFTTTFARCGFRRESIQPGYGLAEATLKVTGRVRTTPPVYCVVAAESLEKNRVVETTEDQAGSRTLVGVGQAALGTTIAIVDPEKRTRCAADEVGEVWVSSPSVGSGYWGHTEETARTFSAYLTDTGEGPFLRTGDLGFIKRGEVYITGRLKELIIVDGQNHYPHDIELTVEQSHPAIRASCCACFSVEQEGQERVVVMVELERTRRHASEEEVAKAIRQAVAENHDLRLHAVILIRPGTIPKTSSGKIQRQACGASFLAGTVERLNLTSQNDRGINLCSDSGKDHSVSCPRAVV